MGKTYILGNEQSMSWGGNLGTLTIISSLSTNDSWDIHNFVCTALKDATPNDRIIIDLDATPDGVLSLTIAMYIRLSVADLKEIALLPILLVSYTSIIQFLNLGECSQFFLSRSGYAFCSPEEAPTAIQNMERIPLEKYNSHFLDCIPIRPDSTIGSHSMANQWGADVLYRLINNTNVAPNETISKEKAKLYYKYIFLKTTGIASIINGDTNHKITPDKPRLAMSKKILLIDDEAQKSWADVIRKWLFGAAVDVCDNDISIYEDIPDNIRTKIEQDYYDLYLLDLRLRGTKEDNIYNAEEFSGMKVLRKLKSINIGNQVIIITASNKAWNMKALLDAGADGYYIKESPEQQLPLEFSENNFASFKKDVIKALEHNGYKRKLYRRICSLIWYVETSLNNDSDLANVISASIRSSLKQIMSAKTKDDFAYAYLALFQVIECICQDYVKRGKRSDNWLINHDIPLHSYKTEGYTTVKQSMITREHPSIKERITAIYIEVGGQNDARFIRENIGLAIDRRNAFVHNDTAKLSRTNISQIYTENGFIDLLDVVEKILKTICSDV